MTHPTPTGEESLALTIPLFCPQDALPLTTFIPVTNQSVAVIKLIVRLGVWFKPVPLFAATCPSVETAPAYSATATAELKPPQFVVVILKDVEAIDPMPEVPHISKPFPPPPPLLIDFNNEYVEPPVSVTEDTEHAKLRMIETKMKCPPEDV